LLASLFTTLSSPLENYRVWRGFNAQTIGWRTYNPMKTRFDQPISHSSWTRRGAQHLFQ
jgi:hypothetical protein